jgi:hypothetical protein
MDELTRRVLFSRLRDPAWRESVLDPYSEERRRGAPRGRTPPLEKREKAGGVYRPENIRQKSVFNWGPDYTGVNVLPSLESLIQRLPGVPETSFGKRVALPGNFEGDVSGYVGNFRNYLPRTYGGEAGVSYRSPKFGGRVGTQLRGRMTGEMPSQELLFEGYLNNLFGGRLTGGASSTIGRPGSTAANIQYRKQF